MAAKKKLSRGSLAGDTREVPGESSARGTDEVITLTILGHADPSRIGEVARLPELSGRAEVALSRTEPDFVNPAGGESWPLADPFLSRRPAMLRGSAGGLSLSRAQDAVAVVAGGAPVERDRTFSEAELKRGIVLELGQRVVIFVNRAEHLYDRPPDLGIIGESAAIHRVRRNILRVADMPVPILLRGETGTGKELVAEAIHRSSSRASRPCLSVNMAAISPAIASSELFGHAKGAFTGAVDDHAGFFERANGGTLFLDEIGETPVEVQVMLLRTLETGRVQPVGGRSERAVDVRLIAATDADLEALVRAGKFRAPLLHRLAGFELLIPPLRERLDDLGRLFVHFLRLELERLGEVGRLDSEAQAAPWIPAPLIARLARYDWPGNVRQLRNVARQLVIASRDAPALAIDRSVERLLSDAAPPPKDREPANAVREVETGGRRKPSEVTEEELLAALKANRFRLEPTAAVLRISRPSLYMLIEKSTRLRKAKDVPEEEILRLHRELDGDVEAMAEKLEVSSRGLYLRVKEILSRST
jgi:two-component system nitrogen regulation response regulator GlnG